MRLPEKKKLARVRRAGKSRAPTDKKGTGQTEMVGGKIRGQWCVLPEAGNQCGWAVAELIAVSVGRLNDTKRMSADATVP